MSIRIRLGIIAAVNDYCCANPIQRREFIRRCLALYLDWLDEDDAAEERFVRERGGAPAAPRPRKRIRLSLQGDKPFQMMLTMPTDLIAKLNARAAKDNISRSELVDRALEFNLDIIAWGGEWVCFEDVMFARGGAA